jgi:jumonji domain-containing protein 2
MPVSSMKARLTAPIDIPKAMVFKPTMEEFKDFSGYIRHIESAGGHHAGICKIIPPDEWIPRKEGYNVDSFKFDIETPIKQQFSQIGRSGAYQTKGMIRPKMTVKVI